MGEYKQKRTILFSRFMYAEMSRPTFLGGGVSGRVHLMAMFYYRVEPYKHNNYMAIDNHT
jgi:hypothetical protein